MRDPERIDAVLEELEQYWRENPDLRLGQIVGGMGQRCGYGLDPFYMEDDEFIKTLKSIRNQE